MYVKLRRGRMTTIIADLVSSILTLRKIFVIILQTVNMIRFLFEGKTIIKLA